MSMGKETSGIIVGLAGKKRSGKSSAANILRQELAKEGYQPVRLGFADYLKNQVTTVTGPLNDEEKCMVRPALQNLADFYKYRYGQRFFIQRWLEIHEVFASRGVNAFIIDDVRYPFEAEWIQEQGGVVYKMVRDDDGDQDNDQHSSETSVDLIEAEQWTLSTFEENPDYVVSELLGALS